MKLFSTILFALLLTMHLQGQTGGADLSPGLAIDSIYIPTGGAVTPGNGVFTGILSSLPRTHQLLIHQDELTALIGKEIKGLSVRLPGSATAEWPAAEVTYTNYDIYLSGSVAPADRSLTFALNVVGPQTLVRSGSLIIAPNVYPFGGSPNYCGTEITFITPWLYSGSHLLIEIRHTGSNGTSRTNDAWTTSSPGYGVMFTGAWTGSYTGTTGSQANFSVLRLTFDDPIPVELTSFTGIADNGNVNLNWTTSTESNNSGFQVERYSGTGWMTLGFVQGNGTTTEIQHYSFIDKNVAPGVYNYRLKQFDYDGSYEYSQSAEVQVDVLREFSLQQNYPNPFNPSTKINYSVPEVSMVILELFDILGSKIETLVNEVKSTGSYEITWNAGNIPAGVYFYRIQAIPLNGQNSFTETKQMTLIK